MADKGAIQLSLGFIIAIVIAVVLLSLILSWLRGMMAGVTDLTTTMQQEATIKLRESFRERGGNYDIYPPYYEAVPATRISVSAGLKNDAGDGKPHDFVVGVRVESMPEAAIREGWTKDRVMGWIEWAKAPKRIAINYEDNIPIIITIPAGAIKGNYIFRISTCSDLTAEGTPYVGTLSADACISTSENLWGGSAKDFILLVKA